MTSAASERSIMPRKRVMVSLRAEASVKAAMLSEKRTYVEIAEKTGASTATISRVNRCLHYGTDGYKLAIDRVKAKKEQEEME